MNTNLSNRSSLTLSSFPETICNLGIFEVRNHPEHLVNRKDSYIIEQDVSTLFSFFDSYCGADFWYYIISLSNDEINELIELHNNDSEITFVEFINVHAKLLRKDESHCYD